MRQVASNDVINYGSYSSRYRSMQEEQLDKMARKTKFLIRSSRKLKPLAMVSSLLYFVGQETSSLRLWACWITNTFIGISKQGLWKRINMRTVSFLKLLLGELLKEVGKMEEVKSGGVFNSFGRVILQDSTTLNLPLKFAGRYPGSANQRASFAAMKIQLIYDLIAGTPISFSLSSFRRNDQAAAYDVVKLAQAGDLILRDLGYFVLGSFRDIANKGAFFLSRYQMGTVLYIDSSEGQERFDLGMYLKRMKKQGLPAVELNVFLGAKERLPIRFVAVRVPDEVAEQRKRKAKENRDKRLKASDEKLAMLDWEIMITNVTESIWTTKAVCEIYGFRWRIETVFKVWKSHFNLANIPDRCSHAQLLCIAYARLIHATLFHAGIWLTCRLKLTDSRKRLWVSPLKLAGLLRVHFDQFFIPTITGQLPERLTTLIAKFGTYDKRARFSTEELLHYYMDGKLSRQPHAWSLLTS